MLHVGEIGMATATDVEILNYAHRHHPACVTLDADFHALLAIRGVTAPSVVRVRREGLDGQAFANLPLGIWEPIATAVQNGAMIAVTERSIRVHCLPVARNAKANTPLKGDT